MTECSAANSWTIPSLLHRIACCTPYLNVLVFLLYVIVQTCHAITARGCTGVTLQCSMPPADWPLAPELNSEYIVGIVMLDFSHINHVINNTNLPTVPLSAYISIVICVVHWTCGVLLMYIWCINDCLIACKLIIIIDIYIYSNQIEGSSKYSIAI